MTSNESAEAAKAAEFSEPAQSAEASGNGSRPLVAGVDPADAVHAEPAAPVPRAMAATPPMPSTSTEAQRAPRADTARMSPRSEDAGSDPGALTGALAAALARALCDIQPTPSSRPGEEAHITREPLDPATQGDAHADSASKPPAGVQDVQDIQDAMEPLPREAPPSGEFVDHDNQDHDHDHERRRQAAEPGQDPAASFNPVGARRERRQDSERANEPRDGAPVAATCKATHDELLLGLGRRFRGASLKIDFELSANITRQIFRRDFVYVSQQLHALEASRRVQGLERKWLNGALGVIERHGEGVKTLLQLTSAEVVELIARSGHASTQAKFGPAARLQATIVSPCARAFVDLLQTADAALMQLERAWLLGLVDPETKGQRAADCRRALQGYKEIVRQQRHVVGEQVREVNALRQGKRADGAPTAEASRPSGTRHSISGNLAADSDASRHKCRAETSHAQRTRRSSHETYASHDPRVGVSRTADESGTA